MNHNKLIAIGLILTVGAFLIAGYVEGEMGTGNFQYQIEECSTPTEDIDENIDLETTGNSFQFTQTLSTYCNANEENLKLEYTKEGKTIEIEETFDSETAARCICPLEITGNIKNLEEGQYTIKFTFNNKHTNQTTTKGTYNFTI